MGEQHWMVCEQYLIICAWQYVILKWSVHNSEIAKNMMFLVFRSNLSQIKCVNLFRLKSELWIFLFFSMSAFQYHSLLHCQVKTRVVRRTLHPVYDEDFTFYGVHFNQLPVSNRIQIFFISFISCKDVFKSHHDALLVFLKITVLSL